MFKTIKRWFTNLRWLFNHPPTCFLGGDLPTGTVCSYCGKGPDMVFYYPHLNWAYCHECQKKVFDWVLIDSMLIHKDKETGKVVHNLDK
jgi:hypothetical protein